MQVARQTYNNYLGTLSFGTVSAQSPAMYL